MSDRGINSRVNKICPTCVDTQNPKYLLIDDVYTSGIFINNYNKEMDGGFLERLISSDVDFEISIFYEKQSSYETIKNLTSYISSTGANIKMSTKNQIDIDMMNTSYENAKYIKRELQVENNDLYYLNIYILTFASNESELEVNLQRIESLAVGCGLRH